MPRPIAFAPQAIRKLLVGLAFVSACIAGHAQHREFIPGQPAPDDKVRIQKNVRFGVEDKQLLDVYLPPAPAFRPPVVICWFGGAFWGADKSQLGGLAAHLASHGIAAITPGYFLGTKDGSRASWPRAVYDAKSAVRYVRAHAGEFNIDPDRIVALGYSSGAYLAMMVGFTPNLTELEGPGENLDVATRVSAVVEIAGVTDRRRDVGLPLALLGSGYEEKTDLRVVTSPVIYVSPKTVPVYILHGNHDSVCDVSCATQLDEALTAVHVPHVLRLVDADHDPFTGHEVELIVDWLKKLPSPRTE